MFKKLKQHWKVNTLNLVLIIATFALGGSVCGYAGRKLLALTSLDRGFLWVVLYIFLITLLWPLAVLLVSIPLGQFQFFKRYIVRVLGRFGARRQDEKAKINIAIFASGGGSNAKILQQARLKRKGLCKYLLNCM
jgi:hypothetical protein